MGCTAPGVFVGTAAGIPEDAVGDTAGRIPAAAYIGEDTLAGTVGSPFAGRLAWPLSAARCLCPDLPSLCSPVCFALRCPAVLGGLAWENFQAAACVPRAAASAAPRAAAQTCWIGDMPSAPSRAARLPRARRHARFPARAWGSGLPSRRCRCPCCPRWRRRRRRFPSTPVPWETRRRCRGYTVSSYCLHWLRQNRRHALCRRCPDPDRQSGWYRHRRESR